MKEKAFPQHAILCEGYDDRSFWAGWLGALGCEDRKGDPNDVWGRPVRGEGRFVFQAPTGARIILHPVGGRSRLRPFARTYLADRNHRFDRVVVNLDPDLPATEARPSEGYDLVRGIVEHYRGSATGEGRFRVGETEVVAVVWECDDPPETPGVPEKQTLERLVAASIVAAYPDRARAVVDWLAAEPLGGDGPKHHGYSYLAKWWAEHGADDFFRELWRDEVVARELEARLRASGAWERIEALVAG